MLVCGKLAQHRLQIVSDTDLVCKDSRLSKICLDPDYISRNIRNDFVAQKTWLITFAVVSSHYQRVTPRERYRQKFEFSSIELATHLCRVWKTLVWKPIWGNSCGHHKILSACRESGLFNANYIRNIAKKVGVLKIGGRTEILGCTSVLFQLILSPKERCVRLFGGCLASLVRVQAPINCTV